MGVLSLSQKASAPESRPPKPTLLYLNVLAIAVLGAILVLHSGPKGGKVQISIPNGPAVEIQIPDKVELAQLVRDSLKDPVAGGPLSAELLQIIETNDGPLRAGLVELAADERPPFYMEAKPAQVVADPSIPRRSAKVCERSNLAKNIAIFVMNNEETMFILPEIADVLRIPCAGQSEVIHVNPDEIPNVQHTGFMAKRVF